MNARKTNEASDRLLGVGVYNAQEAAALSGAKVIDVRRWLFGYDFKLRGGAESYSPPLWPTELADQEVEAIGFHDLLELRFVKAFREYGVSLQAIRVAASYARDLFKTSHPFTTRRFRTDGRSIFGEVHEKTGDPALVDMVRRQDVFRSVMEPGLYAGIEFDESGKANRWFPSGMARKIVLDPLLSFGAPIVVHGSVPTSILAASFEAEDQDPQMVGRLYGVPRDAVVAAVKFEQRLAA